MVKARKPQAPAHERVKTWREKNGLTPTEMAERVGIAHSNIYLIELGRQSITAPMALKLARVMGCGWANLVVDRLPNE